MNSIPNSREACSQICPGCHVLPSKVHPRTFEVNCDHAIEAEDEFVGFIPAMAGTADPELGLITGLACLVPESKMQPV
jgi:hypothetical protein